MENFIGEVVATPGEYKPYRVVIRKDGKVLAQLDVVDRMEGEAMVDRLIECLTQLSSLH